MKHESLHLCLLFPFNFIRTENSAVNNVLTNLLFYISSLFRNRERGLLKLGNRDLGPDAENEQMRYLTTPRCEIQRESVY